MLLSQPRLGKTTLLSYILQKLGILVAMISLEANVTVLLTTSAEMSETHEMLWFEAITAHMSRVGFCLRSVGASGVTLTVRLPLDRSPLQVPAAAQDTVVIRRLKCASMCVAINCEPNANEIRFRYAPKQIYVDAEYSNHK